MTSTPEERAARRAEVHRLTHDQGLTQRVIATRLGISKETVKRDLRDLRLTPGTHADDPERSDEVTPGSDNAPHDPTAHVPPMTHPGPGATPGSGPAHRGTPDLTPASPAEAPGPPTRAVRDALAAGAARAHAAMAQLKAAVAEVVDARVPYTLVRDEVATDWAAQLRQASDTLINERQQFADYYEAALIAGAVTPRRTPGGHPAPTPITRDHDPAPPTLRLRTPTPPPEAA